MKVPQILLALLMVAAVMVGPAMGVAYAERDNTPKELKHVGVDEHLDAQLPLDAIFRDEAGKMVKLGDYFGDAGAHGGEPRPAMLILAYHSCPVLCGMVQNAAATALKQIAWTAGKDFNVVVVSIDPRDTPETAQKKRAGIIGEYGRQGAEEGFHFLVGDKTQIDRVATAVGFQYEYDERQQQYAHPAVVMLAKPNGQVARYLYGLEYDPKDVRLGLLEASNGRSISTIDKIILYCYHYDPQDGKYSLMATRVMRLGGALTVLILGTFLGVLWARERRRKPEDTTTHSGSSGLDHPVTEN
jgi:protein SCO1/2